MVKSPPGARTSMMGGFLNSSALPGTPVSAGSISSFDGECGAMVSARATPLAADNASAAASERASFDDIGNLLVRAGRAPAHGLMWQLSCDCFILWGWRPRHAGRCGGSDRRPSGDDERREPWHGRPAAHPRLMTWGGGGGRRPGPASP